LQPASLDSRHSSSRWAPLQIAASVINSCEACNADAEIPLDWVLDYVTNHLGSRTDYILAAPARCPNCGHEITEKTLVEPTND
jgi:hypothetical protein